MTTVAHVRQVVQPILDRNSDLGLVGRMVVIKPVGHVLRMILIDRDSDPDSFTPAWATLFLFQRFDRVFLNWGRRLYNKAHGPWLMSNPKTPMALCIEIESEVLPMLRPVDTIDDFTAFIAQDPNCLPRLEHVPVQRATVEAALGNLDVAEVICKELDTEKAKTFHALYSADDYDGVVGDLYPLIVARDRAGIASLLHEWERYTVGKLKLDKLWEPTPFPIEKQIAREDPNQSRSLGGS